MTRTRTKSKTRIPDPITGLNVHCQDANGYVRLRAPGHPLATGQRDVVARHRIVLYEDLNAPEFSDCHWCGYELPWRSDDSPAYKFSVNVDHLNGVKGDDRPDNLVPSCFWCNMNRQWMEEEICEHDRSRIYEIFGFIPPHLRPNLPSVYESLTGSLPIRIAKFRAEREATDG